MRSLAIFVLLLATACATTPPPAAQPVSQPAAAAAPEPEPAATADTRPRGVILPARGLSCNSAIVINATNEQAGIAEENAWIKENYPGAQKVGQSLLTCNDKAADQVDIETANGRKVSVYFDISNFFGKH
jgi:uncharacterized lipoprotein YmbA